MPCAGRSRRGTGAHPANPHVGTEYALSSNKLSAPGRPFTGAQEDRRIAVVTAVRLPHPWSPMTTRYPLLAAAAVLLAACEQAPTATSAPGGARASYGNQAPVAVISIDSTRLVGATYRHYLNAAGSYDPEGTALTYSWTTPCPDADTSRDRVTFGVQSTYPGDQCRVSLKVTDAYGAIGSSGILLDDSSWD